MYRIDDTNRFLEVTYQGVTRRSSTSDFASGAMIENIVRRAKKLAVKREIAGKGRGLVTDDLFESIAKIPRERRPTEHDQSHDWLVSRARR